MLLLKIDGVVSGYGRLEVLHGVSLGVDEGEIVSVLGANGAGKTTLLRTVSGILPTWSGTTEFGGSRITGAKPERVAALGLGHLPEGRGVLQSLTVLENLQIGAVVRRDGSSAVKADLDRVLSLFPVLGERVGVAASSLSGGQQQMLAIGRALMARPRLVMIDELSFGLAPLLVHELFTLLQDLRGEGMTFLLVEQQASVLAFSDRTYVMRTGRVVFDGPSADLRDAEDLIRSYLGGEEPHGERAEETAPT